MTVNGVNNSNNNAGAYIALPVVVGGAGAAYGYFSKPHLHRGKPSAELIDKVQKDTFEALSEEQKAIQNSWETLEKDLSKVKTPDDLKSLLKNNEAYKSLGEVYNTHIIQQLDNEGVATAKSELENVINSYKKSNKEASKELVESCWDSKAKKFVYDSKKVTKEDFDIVKGAARKIQLKKAGYYGGICAGIALLGAFIGEGLNAILNNNNNTNKEV